MMKNTICNTFSSATNKQPMHCDSQLAFDRELSGGEMPGRDSLAGMSGCWFREIFQGGFFYGGNVHWGIVQGECPDAIQDYKSACSSCELGYPG